MTNKLEESGSILLVVTFETRERNIYSFWSNCNEPHECNSVCGYVSNCFTYTCPLYTQTYICRICVCVSLSVHVSVCGMVVRKEKTKERNKYIKALKIKK